MPPLRYFASFFCLHHLRHEAAHRLCGFVLLLPRSVGVGAECESSVIVAEHTADGFDVHPILQCQRCEGVSEVVKSDVRQPGVLQDLLVQIYDGVWVVHLTSTYILGGQQNEHHQNGRKAEYVQGMLGGLLRRRSHRLCSSTITSKLWHWCLFGVYGDGTGLNETALCIINS